VNRERLAVLALFVAAPLVFVVQTVVTDHKSEPYPALTLPAFGAAPTSENVAVTNDPTFEVTFADGTSDAFDETELIGRTDVPPLFIARLAFWSKGPITRDLRTAAWLRQRIDELAPGRKPTQVEVVWTRTQFRLPSGEVESTTASTRVVIEL
jgi:hypothetical protein